MSILVNTITNIPATGLTYIDGIRWGNRWQIESDSRKLTYSFITNQNWDDDYLYPAEETAIHTAMQAWANVANIKLEYAGYNDINAELTFHSVPGYIIDGALGMAISPGEAISNNYATFYPGDVVFNWEAYPTNPTSELRVGSYDYLTYVHEIGHALGLAHPHDEGGNSTIYPGVNPSYPFTSTGTYGLNQYVWTVMSYVDTNSSYSPGYDTNWGYIGGPMAFDIAAIQSLYGINTTYNTGNNTYNLPTINGVGTYWSSIWDAGGIDTISGQSATTSVTINLNNASLANNDPNAGGYINQVSGIKGGFTIAKAQGNLGIIENAIGGSGNDLITGNAVANTLTGGAGNDTLSSGAGNDTLNGNTGNDSMSGGTGNDIYSVDSSFDTVTENSNEGTDTIQSSVTHTLGSNIENLTLTGTAIINGTGNTFNNTIRGNSEVNEIYGGLGVDLLYGGAGNDILDGGTPTTYDSSNDRLYGQAGDDELWGGTGLDYLDGGDGADLLWGWDGNDSLLGGTGNDDIYGSAGNDTLIGHSGQDFFVFNSKTEGIDRITDFNVFDDAIAVSLAGFGGGLTANAYLNSSQFKIGTAATAATHKFIYNNTTGALYFDQDGTGLIGQVQIATLNSSLALTNNDIYVMA